MYTLSCFIGGTLGVVSMSAAGLPFSSALAGGFIGLIGALAVERVRR